MNIIGRIACALSLVALCSSCSESIFDDNAYAYKSVEDSRVVIDPELAKKFRVISVDYGMNEMGFYGVKVTGECEKTPAVAWSVSSDKQLAIEYRFTWKDKKGAFIQDASCSSDPKVIPADDLSIVKWQTRTSMPGDIVGFCGVSPSYDYTDFRLELREKPPGVPEAAPVKKCEEKKSPDSSGK